MGQEEYKYPKIFFKEKNETIQNTEVINDIPKKEKIKLFFSLQDCVQDTLYQIKICSLNNNNYEILFETSKLEPDEDNLIEYDNTYLLPYFFEKEQKIFIQIVINDKIFDYETTLGCIIGSKNSTLCRKICNEREEKIKIQGTKVEVSKNSKLKIHFRIKKDKINKNSFNETKFLFIISSSQDLYRSEIVSSDGYLQPAIIPIYYLTPKFNITFYTVKKEVLISFSNLTYEKFLIMNGIDYPLYYNKKKKMKKFDLIIDTEIIGTTKTFLDYIKSNLQLKLEIAIDFSKKNKELHNINDNKMNRYEETIKYIGDIVSYYNDSQLFSVWGFGADNIPEQFNRMCFPINFKKDSNIEKIDGVLKEYKKCLNKINFSEQSEFSPVVKHIIKMIEEDKEHFNEYYNILLLLTEGKYDDREEIIKEIVKVSKIPMSIIIIGLQDLRKQTCGEFDIVYMIDSTGSMGNYLKAARDQCINISNELQNIFTDFSFKFGGVFYRDPIDCPNEKNEIFDLNDDVLSLKFFISNVKPIGGGDEAEDWAGGYKLAINHINWRNGLKVIIHICDADSHGKEYTNSEDHHPNEGVKIPPLIEKCVEKQIKVIGFNINKGANTSFNEFKKLYNLYDKKRRGLYKIRDFEETENLDEYFKDLVIKEVTSVASIELIGENEQLIGSNKEKWGRDIVQFVPYDKYKNNPKLLTEKVLEKIPSQVVQYYNNKKIKDVKKDGFFIVDDYEIMTF